MIGDVVLQANFLYSFSHPSSELSIALMELVGDRQLT